MVTFALAKRSDRELIYYYYPEGNEAKTPGKIRVNLQNKKIEVIRIAEDDMERDIPPEEMNELINAINDMKREAGKSDFVELETESSHSIWYGDHAIREIEKQINQGVIPERGMQAWY